MPQFTEIEKRIINAIESQQNVGTMMLGMVAKDILFQSGKSAFVICGDVTEKWASANCMLSTRFIQWRI